MQSKLRMRWQNQRFLRFLLLFICPSSTAYAVPLPPRGKVKQCVSWSIIMEILYRDNSIVVCIKPAGVLSTDEEGGMPSLLRAELGTDCVRSVHRLDRVVSGVMV